MRAGGVAFPRPPEPCSPDRIPSHLGPLTRPFAGRSALPHNFRPRNLPPTSHADSSPDQGAQRHAHRCGLCAPRIHTIGRHPQADPEQLPPLVGVVPPAKLPLLPPPSLNGLRQRKHTSQHCRNDLQQHQHTEKPRDQRQRVTSSILRCEPASVAGKKHETQHTSPCSAPRRTLELDQHSFHEPQRHEPRSGCRPLDVERSDGPAAGRTRASEGARSASSSRDPRQTALARDDPPMPSETATSLASPSRLRGDRALRQHVSYERGDDTDRRPHPNSHTTTTK